MAKFNVKYQPINKKTKASLGTMTAIITATNMSEARQVFKYHHADTDAISYKIIAVVKTGK
jgi:hypothetical protein